MKIEIWVGKYFYEAPLSKENLEIAQKWFKTVSDELIAKMEASG